MRLENAGLSLSATHFIYSTALVHPSVHVGADDSFGGATKTVSPVPSRARREREREDGQHRGEEEGMTAPSQAVTSRRGTRRQRRWPARTAMRGGRPTLQAAPVAAAAAATSPLCHGRRDRL